MRTFAITTLTFAAVFGWYAGSRAPDAAPPPAAAAPAAADDWSTPHASPGTIVLDRGWNGHFFVSGEVKGRTMRFIVDTGASTVALSRKDAEALGVDMDHLTFDGQAQTASGTVRVAQVTLPELRIGDIQLIDVKASVIDVPDTGMALLGQSFLDRLDKVSIENDRMTLTKS